MGGYCGCNAVDICARGLLFEWFQLGYEWQRGIWLCIDICFR